MQNRDAAGLNTAAGAQLQQLVQAIAGKAFYKGVTKPSRTLTLGEHTCIAKAMDRYMDAMTVGFATLSGKSSSKP